MKPLNIKNAAISGAIGIIVFMMLLGAAPFSTSKSKTDGGKSSKAKDRLERQYDLRGSKKSEFFLNPDKTINFDSEWGLKEKPSKEPYGQMDPEDLVQLCATSANIDVESEAFAWLKKVNVLGKTKREKDKVLSDLDKVLTLTDDLCEDGKPKK